MSDLGYKEPSTLGLDIRFAEGVLDRIPGLVSDLEQRGVSLIVTHAQATVPVVKAPRKVPVAYQFSADPASAGIADDLARPRFNATGVTLLAAELDAKRIELLREIAPECRQIGVVYNPLHPGEHLERAWIDERTSALGLTVAYYPTADRAALGHAVDQLRSEKPGALLLLPDGFIAANAKLIVDFALMERLPVISGWGQIADAGALLSYGPSLVDAYRRSAYFADKILRGTSASDIPIERATVLELVLNMKTASQIGTPISQTVLAQADRVIE
jgi:putative ABC transport system substrate-binding protein